MPRPRLRRTFRALHAAFHQPDSREGRVTETAVWTLIVLSIVLFGLELGLQPHGRAARVLVVADRVVLVLFAVELVLRVVTYHPPALDFFTHSATNRVRHHVLGRLAFCLRPLVLVDILTVLALVPALRGLRAVRLLRLLRTVHVFRYAHPLQGIVNAFRDNALLYGFGFSILGMASLVGGLSFALVEAPHNAQVDSAADGLWWALVTLTTVGFGDITPVTALGRVLAGVVMLAGMFMLALFAGIVGNTLLHSVLNIRKEQLRMSIFLNHVVICGYDPGARILLDAITEETDLRTTDVVIFSPGERPASVPTAFKWIDGDFTKESELDKVRLTHAAAALIVGSRRLDPQHADATTILTAFTIRRYLSRCASYAQRKRPLYVTAEILDSENVEHARTAGADEVIETTRVGFSLLAHSISMPGTADVMSRVAVSGAHSVYVGLLPDDLPTPISWVELICKVRAGHRMLPLGLRIPGGEDLLNPPDDRQVSGEEQLIYLAERPLLSPVAWVPRHPLLGPRGGGGGAC